MLCHLGISMTDIWVAGQISSGIMAVMGFITQISGLLMLLVSIVGSGCMATVSQALGRKNSRRASRYSFLILGISLAAGCCVAAFGLLLLPFICNLSLIPDDLRAPAFVFGLAYALQVPFFYCMIMLNSIFRAHKLVWLPLCTLFAVCILNYIGSAGFGLGLFGMPKTGYPAIAWATFISAVTGFGLNILMALKWKILRIRNFPPLRWSKMAAPRLWRIGTPVALGNLGTQLGNLTLLTILAGLPGSPVAAVAGMTLGNRIMAFLLMPLGALGMSVTILSGYFSGARNYGHAFALGKRCAFWSALAMAVAAVMLVLARERITGFFADNPAAIEAAGQFLLISCCALPLQAVSMIINSVLAGAGITKLPCIVSLAGMWWCAVPLAWAFGLWMNHGFAGVYFGMALGTSVTAVWMLGVFLSERWIPAAYRNSLRVLTKQ